HTGDDDAADEEDDVVEPQHVSRETSGRHRGAEESGCEAAHRRARVERALEEERTPALEPALADRARGADRAEHEQWAANVDAPVLARVCLSACECEREREEDRRG